jgi:putative salt-induced outer membrane protein YdiY
MRRPLLLLLLAAAVVALPGPARGDEAPPRYVVPPPPPPPPLPGLGGAAPFAPGPALAPALTPAPVLVRDVAPVAAQPVPAALTAPCATCPPAESAEARWLHELGLTASVAEGNKDFWNLNVSGKVRYESPAYALEAGGRFVYAENRGDRTAETWRANVRGERNLTTRSYLFAEVTYDRDEVAGLDHRITGLLGYGTVLLKESDRKLKGEVGGGATFEQRVGRPESVDPSAYLGLDYEQTWADKSSLGIELDVLPNLGDIDLSVIRLDVDYTRPLSSCLNLTFSVLVEYVLDPGDAEQLDLLLGVGLKLCW